MRTSRTYGLTVRVESVIDLAPPGQVWTINDRTGLLETRVPLTWTGVRVYHFADGPQRVLRRPEQVMSPGHLDTLKRLVVTHGHPSHRGKPINITRDNARRFGVGHTGDAITAEVVHGYTVPVANVSVHSPTTIAAIEDVDAPATQTSLGYVALFGLIGGVWDGPAGPVPFDVEHVLDPKDERVLELVEETKDEETPFVASSLGANHLAAALRYGRGGELSELMAPVRDQARPSTSWFSHTPTGTRTSSSACRVFMYRDAAGISPTPTEDQEMPEAKKFRVQLVADGLTFPRRFVDVDEETAAVMSEMLAAMGAQLTEMSAKLAGVEGERDAAVEKTEQAEGAQAAAEGEQAVAAKETEEMRDNLSKAEAKILVLEAVLSPSDELLALRKTAGRIHDADYSRMSEGEVKRTAVDGKSKSDHSKSPDRVVDAVWDTFVEQLGSTPKTPAKRWDHKNQPRHERDNAKPSKGQSVLANLNPAN